MEGFRCYDIEKTFNLPNSGLLLLKGPSGIGKSSILDAINFVLYNTGNKIITFGSKKCKVCMKFDNWIITRTKGPNRLVLKDENGEEYEDDAAQEIINDKYGVNFNITSYITQKGMDNFFHLGANERMAFLEKLAFGNTNITEIKKKCKLKIKERKDKLNERVGELKVITEEAKNIIQPEEIEFPLNGKYSDVKIKNESIRWKRNTNKLIKTREQLEMFKTQQTECILQQQKLEQLQSQLNNLSTQYDSINNEIINLPPSETDKIESRINYLKLNKELIQTKNSYCSDNQQYQASCAIELSQLQDEYDKLLTYDDIQDNTTDIYNKSKIKEKVMKNKIKISKLKKEIDDYDSIDNYISAIDDLRIKEQELLNKQLKLKNKLTVHKCPKCSVFLRLNDNKLDLAADYTDDNDTQTEDDIKKEIKTVRTDKNEYEESLLELKNLSSQLEKCENEYNQHVTEIDVSIDYEKLLNKLKEQLFDQEQRKKRISNLEQKINNKEFSLTIQALKRRLDLKNETIKKLEATIDNYKDNLDIPEKDDIDALTDILTSNKLIKQKRDMLTNQLKQLTIKMTKLNEQINQINIMEVDFDDMIRTAQQEIQELEATDSEHKKTNLLIQKYLEYKKEYDNYVKWQDKLTVSKDNEKNARLSLTTAEKLLRKVLETESVAVMNIIENINNHLQFYLDKFFNDPIEVEIKSFKETVGGEIKPRIDISVGYKGSETDINALSGGERARVEMAICLAINSLIGNRILLIDEALSSLDPDTVEQITDILKLEAQEQNKLIITILHQSKDSNFDNVIELF